MGDSFFKYKRILFLHYIELVLSINRFYFHLFKRVFLTIKYQKKKYDDFVYIICFGYTKSIMITVEEHEGN